MPGQSISRRILLLRASMSYFHLKKLIKQLSTFPAVSPLKCTDKTVFNLITFFILGPLLVHLTAAIILMSGSWYFHLFLCESEPRYKWLQCVDFSGICIMICGSTTSPFYYSFMCEENWWYGRLYIGQVWSFCLIALILTLCNDSKWVNAVAYIVAGYSTVPAMLHLLWYTTDESVHDF